MSKQYDFANYKTPNKYKKDTSNNNINTSNKYKVSDNNFMNTIGRTSGTANEAIDNVLTGIFSVPEGVVDFFATGISSLLGTLGNSKAEEKINKFIENKWADDAALFYRKYGYKPKLGGFYDFLNKAIDEPRISEVNGKRISDYSYTYDLGEQGHNFVVGIEESIGQMLAKIAIAQGIGSAAEGLGAGTHAVGKITEGVGLGITGLSAGGSSASQALSEGASSKQALAYGTLSGVTEAGIESLSGIFGNKIPGLGTATKKTFGSIVLDAVGEGGEEVASEFFDSLIKPLTYTNHYEAPTLEELFMSFASGTIVGGLFGGLSSDVQTDAQQISNGINGNLEKISTLAEQFRKGEITEQQFEAKKEKLLKDNSRWAKQINELLKKAKKQGKDILQEFADAGIAQDGKSILQNDGGIYASIDPLTAQKEAQYKFTNTNVDEQIKGGIVNEQKINTEFGGQPIINNQGIRNAQTYTTKNTTNQKGEIITNEVLERNSKEEIVDNRKVNVVDSTFMANNWSDTVKLVKQHGLNIKVFSNSLSSNSNVEVQAFINGDTVYINSAYASDSRHAMHEILHTKINDETRQKIIDKLKKMSNYDSIYEAYAEAYSDLSSIDIEEEIAIDAMAQLDAFEGLEEFKEVRDEILQNKTTESKTKDKRNSIIFQRLNDLKRRNLTIDSVYTLDEYIVFKKDLQNKTYVELYSIPNDGQYDDLIDSIEEEIRNEEINRSPKIINRVTEIIKSRQRMYSSDNVDAQQIRKSPNNDDGISSKQRESNSRPNNGKSDNYRKDKRSINLENVKKGERSDEFRRIQEESRKLSSSISQQERVNSFDDSLYKRIRGILSREIRSFRGRNFDTSRLVVNNDNFKVFSNIDGTLFHDCFEVAKTYLKNGELVDLHTNYDDCTCYLSDDGLSGFAITESGDLISVFNLSKEKGWLRAISSIVTKKAKTLDCYVSPHQNLKGMYEAKFGFKTASTMDYNMEYDHDNIAKNHNMPQVAFMVNTTEDVETKHFNKHQYDEAQEYQQSFVKKIKDKRSVKPSVDYAGNNFAKELEVRLSSIFKDSDIKVEYSKPKNVTRISTLIMSSKEENLTIHTAKALAEHMWDYTKLSMDGETFTMSDLYEDISYLAKDLMRTKVRFRSVADVADFYKERYVKAVQEYKEYKAFTILTKQLEKQAQTMFDKASKANKHIGTYTTAKVKAFQEILGKLKNIRKGKTIRSYFASFAKLLEPQSAINMGNDEFNPELTPLGIVYDENMHQFFTELGEGDVNSHLTVKEMTQLKAYLKGLRQQFDRITKNQVVTRTGETVDITKKVEGYVEVSKVNPKVSNNKVFTYLDYISDAEAVCSYLDNHNVYGKGVFTDIHNELIECHNVECATQLEFNDIIDNIMDRKTRKKYSKTLKTKHSVNIGKANVNLSKDEIIALYMTLKDESGYKHIKTSGFYFEGKNGEFVRAHNHDLDIEVLKVSVESLLTEQDKVYISAIESVIRKSKQIKTNVDIKRLGYSNVIDGYYFPLIVHGGDGKSNFGNPSIKLRDIRQVSKTSFNNSRTRSFGALQIVGVTEMIQNYMSGMAKYNAYALEMDYINALFDTRFKDENGKTIHLKYQLNENNEIRNRIFNWLNNYFLDIQGANDVKQKNFIDRVAQFLRRGIITSSLGFNVASPFKQLPAYLLGFSDLRLSSMTKAFGKSIIKEKTKAQVFKYSPYLRMRFESGEVSRGHLLGAEGGKNVFTKAITDIQDVSMVPIQFVDELTILKTFEACKYEVEANHKGDTTYKYGTEENFKEAAKMCEKLVREFQPNYTPVDKSAIQRSNSELMKSLAMFTLQPTKMLSRLRQSAGEIHSLRKAIKETKNNGKSSEALKERLGKANKKFAKTFTAVAMQGIMYTLIGRLIKTIIGKREWEEFFNDPENPILQEFIQDTYIGMFPVIKDLYGLFFNGYEMSLVNIDSVNDLIGTVGKLSTDIIEGKDVNWNNQLRKLSFAISGVLGLPTKNIYDIVYGVVGWFSPETAYKCKNLFYQDSAGNATEAFKKTIEKGNTKQAVTILQTSFINNKTGVAPTQNVLEEITRLYSLGYENIQPKNVSDTMEINGETYQLKAKQKDTFKASYVKANNIMQNIMRTANYKKLTDEQKASLIKRVYTTYYDYSKSKILSTYTPSNKLSILADSSIDMAKVMTILTAVSSIKGTKTKSRKELVQAYIEKQTLTSNDKYLIYALAGYSIEEENEKKLKSYLRIKGLSPIQINTLLPAKE